MRTLSCVLCLALISGCAWFSANSKALSADALGELECVSSALLSGVPVELVACGALLVEDIVNIADAAHITPVPSPALTAHRAKQAAHRR